MALFRDRQASWGIPDKCLVHMSGVSFWNNCWSRNDTKKETDKAIKKRKIWKINHQVFFQLNGRTDSTKLQSTLLWEIILVKFRCWKSTTVVLKSSPLSKDTQVTRLTKKFLQFQKDTTDLRTDFSFLFRIRCFLVASRKCSVLGVGWRTKSAIFWKFWPVHYCLGYRRTTRHSVWVAGPSVSLILCPIFVKTTPTKFPRCVELFSMFQRQSAVTNLLTNNKAAAVWWGWLHHGLLGHGCQTPRGKPSSLPSKKKLVSFGTVNSPS